MGEVRGLPAGFLWGAATSSYQIEGDRGGRGDSIWDVLCAEPGRVVDGSNGDVACDHVHRYLEDVGLLADLGVGAYRFSVSWPRVQPGGSGAGSAEGLGFYDRLVDALLGRGVDPVVTLHHWDLPAELGARGGWASRDVADRFVDYALLVHDRLGDRVRLWATHNEPWCAAYLGHLSGVHAPGRQVPAEAVAAAHHLLLSHGRAVAALRSAGAAGVGITLNTWGFHAAEGSPDSVHEAVRMADGQVTRFWFDALRHGRYPADVEADLGTLLSDVVHDGDLAEIAAPVDWIGVNYYHDDTFMAVEPAAAGGAVGHGTRSPYLGLPPVGLAGLDGPLTDMGWTITPEAFGEHLRRLARDYPGVPLYVTENGAAFDDPVVVAPDGARRVDDDRRVAYLDAHTRAVADAVAGGADVRGYFVWSLLDNFEWAEGYRMRFGIVHVDFATQWRTPKGSYHWYRSTIADHRAAHAAAQPAADPAARD